MNTVPTLNISGPIDFGVTSTPNVNSSLAEQNSVKDFGQMSQPLTSPPDWVLNIQERFTQYDARLSQLEHLVAENQRLRTALDSAHTRIAELEKSFERTADSPRIPSPAIKLVQGSEASKYSDTVDIEPTPIPAPPTAPSFAAAALKGAKAQPKPIASNPKRHRRVTPRQYKAIARSFTTVSESHGYQYIYLPSRNREPISVLRSKLRKLKIDTARILDLHFPDSHVVALLVHNDYSDDLLSIFDKVGVKPITDFNPIDPDHLRDPKFAELDQDTRKHKCVEIHQMRLIRALQHIREPIQRAVARDFLRKTWITVDQFRSLYNTTSATNFSTDPVDTDMVDTIQSFTAPIASSTTFSGAGEPDKEDI